jgi:DNA-binding NarL/FixJ family response regulator
MRKTRVLLADDHQMFLAGLRKLLEPDFDVVGAVEDGRTLREVAMQLDPDVIVADISMPLLNGIDAVRALKAEGCRAHVIFLSMHGDALYVQEAMRAGAAGYVLKRDAPDKLVALIQNAACEGAGNHDSSIPLDSALSPPGTNVRALTARQREIWQLLAEGRTLKEIAWLLGVSVRTVEFHKYQIMKRLSIRRSSELTTMALKHGIIAAAD